MPRYKTIKAVAHNLGHSFVGDMNWLSGDYAMGHALRRARQTRCSVLKIDLITGVFGPPEMRSPEVAEVIRHYVSWFPEMLAHQGSDLSLISAAEMQVRFDHASAKPNPRDPRSLETPYVCHVAITDDRGKSWECDQSGWWTPESDPRNFVRRVRDWMALRIGWNSFRAAPPYN